MFFVLFCEVQRLDFAEFVEPQGESKSTVARAVLRICLVVDFELWQAKWYVQGLDCQMDLLLFQGRNHLYCFWCHLDPQTMVMNDCNRKIYHVVAMRSDVES
jgi:hypothetical protein